MKTSDLKTIKNIFTTYFACKASAKFIAFGEDDGYLNNPYYQYYRDVEVTYYSLKKSERFFIDNEFLYKTDNYWWKGKYNGKDYVRYKKTLIKKFVRLFNEIHY